MKDIHVELFDIHVFLLSMKQWLYLWSFC